MSKLLLRVLFGVALGLSPGVFAVDQTVAEFHTEMGGCESCHEDGANASNDGAYEAEQCQSCHGTLAEMDDKHKAHDGMLMCQDCHATHDMNVGQKPTCDACHDDGRK
ncbi:cytochrome c [Shewanella sp. NFH-SH190041]|uniref:cytochrome c3 family protein n=1 Tax=Shewanella sp. NFH-SH190041 TaxID=2950245 RepID=UPI0021C396EB|nr:cytochrome c3 family protein [Shewanella sp. NFH-SH190041]BDM64768.1 cytochrome c [Shewanella sp. NFH-SH190041]